MKRLVIDVLAFEYGKSFGYQEYICNLLDYFSAHRFDILFDKIVIVCLKQQQVYFEKYLDNFQIKSYNCSSTLKRMLVQSLIPLLLKLTKDDLVVYTANYSSLIKRSRHILIVHDLLFKRKKLFPYRLMRFQRSFYLPISVMLADKIVAISEFTASDIAYYYPNCENKITVIYNYFNFLKFPKQHGCVKRGNYFISVCSTAYHKNTITVLDAFEDYCIKGGEYDLILVGAMKKGTKLYDRFLQMTNTIRRRIYIYENISNEQLALLYQKSKVYISVSLFEGLGMPIVEAMYFNLLVILTDYPVFHEVSMDKGIYCDPLNFEDLSTKMLLTQTIDISTSNFYSDIVSDKYSEQKTSEKYIQLINSFINM